MQHTRNPKPGKKSFLRSEYGGTSIEFVLWVPVFFAVLCLIVDATMIFSNRTHALRVIQDANRAFAIGRLTSTTETENYVTTRLRQMSPNAAAQTTVSQGVIRTAVTMPSSEIDVLGIFDVALNFTVGVSAEHMAEN